MADDVIPIASGRVTGRSLIHLKPRRDEIHNQLTRYVFYEFCAYIYKVGGNKARAGDS